MALTIDFRKDTVSADGVYSYLTDYTVYGGSNPLRNTVAINMSAFKVSEDLSEAQMTVATYNPLTVTQFQVTNTNDGWVKFYILVVPVYTTTVTPSSSLNYVVYDTVTARYYKYINVTPASSTAVTNPTYWSVLTEPVSSVVLNSTIPANCSYQIYNSINTYNLEVCYIKVAIQVAKEICDCGCDGLDTNKTYNLFTQLDALLNAAKIDDAEQLYIAGERACVTATSYCNQCNFC